MTTPIEALLSKWYATATEVEAKLTYQPYRVFADELKQAYAKERDQAGGFDIQWRYQMCKLLNISCANSVVAGRIMQEVRQLFAELQKARQEAATQTSFEREALIKICGALGLDHMKAPCGDVAQAAVDRIEISKRATKILKDMSGALNNTAIATWDEAVLAAANLRNEYELLKKDLEETKRLLASADEQATRFVIERNQLQDVHALLAKKVDAMWEFFRTADQYGQATLSMRMKQVWVGVEGK
jgi:hypothetical protein